MQFPFFEPLTLFFLSDRQDSLSFLAVPAPLHTGNTFGPIEQRCKMSEVKNDSLIESIGSESVSRISRKQVFETQL
jgi:hypothetical protein